MTLTLTPRAVSSSIAGIAGLGGRDLDHHVGPREPVPQLDRLLDRRRGVVGEVGRALERDEAVAPVARVVGGAQQVGGAADVVERELEEELLRVANAGGDGGAQLVVVAVGAGDRLGEDRRVRGRAGDRAVGDQRRERAAVEQLARERVEPDRDAGVVELLEAVHAAPASVAGARSSSGTSGSARRRSSTVTRARMSCWIVVGDVPDVDVHAGDHAIVDAARRR